MRLYLPPFILTVLIGSLGCEGRPGASAGEAVVQAPEQDTVPEGPEWAKDDNIYEVNIRQYTPEGTFDAFRGHLPRLQEMGVDILWFMPVYPISKTRRKGSLGSYYAVSDFTAVNPEFGTLEDFQSLVSEIQDRDMRVILDWVPNHTGWDHHWLREHPDWFTRDSTGQVTDPLDEKTGKPLGWDDVADLNYDNLEMREEMIREMLFWLEEVGVDGFRCDVAWGVPLDFWRQAVPRLREADPEIFLLAEAELPGLRNERLFTASYAWKFHHLMNSIAQGKEEPDAIDEWLKQDRQEFREGWHMHFITNHDENSWAGTVQERLGPAADAMAVLTFTFDGMPLIYSGQEAGLNKRLEFFEKDPIGWGDFPKQEFYATLLDLKHRNRALWNGDYGGEPIRIDTENPQDVYAFYREKDGDKVVVVLNLSADPQDVVLNSKKAMGEYTNVFANSTVTVTRDMMLNLNPWDYIVLSNQ